MPKGFGDVAQEQFHRAERWLHRLSAISNGTFHPISDEGFHDNPQDYVFAAFQNCYHIKDWLKNAPGWKDSIPDETKADAVEQFIEECKALKICADLCNGTKHFDLRNVRSGSTPEFLVRRTKTDVSSVPPTTTTHFTLRTSGGDVDAYILANECLEEWKQFIFKSTSETLQALANRNKRSKKQRKKGHL